MVFSSYWKQGSIKDGLVFLNSRQFCLDNKILYNFTVLTAPSDVVALSPFCLQLEIVMLRAGDQARADVSSSVCDSAEGGHWEEDAGWGDVKEMGTYWGANVKPREGSQNSSTVIGSAI